LSLMVVPVDTPVLGAYPPAEEALGSPNALLQLEAGPPSMS
jgi:hypothetical protein